MTNEQTTQQVLQGYQAVMDAIDNAQVTETNIEDFWKLLQDSENLLKGIMTDQCPPINTPGHVEAGLFLYQLNDLSMIHIVLKHLLKKYKLPPTTITEGEYKAWHKLMKKGAGIVTGDGTLVNTLEYATMDKQWFGAALNYVFLLIGEYLSKELPQFVMDYLRAMGWVNTLVRPFPSKISPAKKTDQDSLQIAVFGDWGTGDHAAKMVANAISECKPHISLHLGDVYYAGTIAEEVENLTHYHFPKGSICNYTMNSNHEMYVGGQGYFNIALQHKLFKAQDGNSYFAVEHKDWMLIGLDSGYFDMQEKGHFDMYLDGALYDENNYASNPQVQFIQSLDIKDKKIVLFTHHHAVRVDGQAINDKLFGQVYTILGNRYPDYWYYGHLHNAVVYDNNSIQKNYLTPSGKPMQLRCTGNAAIPYGDGYFLGNGGHCKPGIAYYGSTNAGFTDNKKKNLVRNGFAILSFEEGEITETFYEADIKDGGSLLRAWSSE